MSLVLVKEDVISERRLTQIDSLRGLLKIIKEINDLSMDYLVQSGGFKPGTNELVNPCAKNINLWEKYEESGIVNRVKELVSENRGSVYYPGFDIVLKENLYGEKPLFNQDYFSRKEAHRVAADMFVIQLLLYDIILFPAE